jgi:hypothetical protein
MNPMKTTPAPLALALAAGFLAASSRASEPPQPPVNLAGTWKLDKSRSDDPARKVMEAMRASGGSERGERGGEGGGMGGSGGGGRGGGGGGSMGGGGREGGGGRGPGSRGGSLFGGEPPLDGDAGEDRPGERAQAQDGRRSRGPMGLAPSLEFMIDQDGDNLAFRTEGNLRLLHTDGEKRKKETDAGRLEVVAKFVKGTLVIESRPEAGGKRREIYSRPSDRTLQVDFEFEGSGPMPGLKFSLVYEAAPAHQF